jgi:nicotinamidase-related amidase
MMAEHDTISEMIRRREQRPCTLDPRKIALLIIDVQRYFVRPQYPLAQVLEKVAPGVTAGYFERVNTSVVPNINRLQSYFRAHHLPIFFTAAGSWLPDGRDLPPWMKDYDELGLELVGSRIWPSINDPSWQIDDGVAPLPGEVVLNKPSSGTFASTRIDQTLRNMGVESLLVTGLTTDICVGLGAREAADRGFLTVIVEDGCTTLSKEMHDETLQAFSLAFGRVRTTEEVLRLLAAKDSDNGCSEGS